MSIVVAYSSWVLQSAKPRLWKATVMEAHLDLSDMAARYRTSNQGIYALRHKGKLPPALRVGGRLLWSLDVVRAWEKERLESADKHATLVA